jgi:putative FmdB family regulatory protein
LPLHEYRCRKCGAVTEKIQKFSDPPLTRCKACGGKLDQLLSAPAIQFKGSGWYVTDYARKAAPEKSSSSSTPHNGNGSESETKQPAKASPPAKAEKPQPASKS